MPFAATWMDLDSHTDWTKSERKGEISYDIPYIWNLKRNDTNELIYKTEKETHRLRKWTYGCLGRKDSWEVWEGHVHTAMFKMDNQQGPIL